MMSARLLVILVVLVWHPAAALSQEQTVRLKFRGQVGDAAFACGSTYAGVGTTASSIRARDFRFYIQDFRLIDDQGKETPVRLTPDGKWQDDSVSLIDFENATGPCLNGTPETNDAVTGTVPGGRVWKGIRFSMGVPFDKNHRDPLRMASPLNLTAMFWVWNSGHKFARIEFATTGLPRGYIFHLGSTGCTPSTSQTTVPTRCLQSNRVDVAFGEFDLSRDVVVADLAELFRKTNVDANVPGTAVGCMSDPADPDCATTFSQVGLPFAGSVPGRQAFFRRQQANP